MYNTTAEYKTEIKKPFRAFECKITIGDRIFHNEDIVDVIIDGNIQPQEGFGIGNTVSTTLDLTLLNKGETIYSTNQIKVEIGLKIGSTIEYILMGYYNIDDIEKTDYTTKFTAFDNMIKFETAYFSNLGDSPTLQQVANELASKTGVQFTGSLPSYTVKKLEGFTCREILSYVASVCGGNAVITRDGKFTIVYPKEINYAITADNYFDYKREEVKYKVGKVTCQIKEKETISKGSLGTDSMELLFENPWVTETILTDIYNKLNGFEYLGYTMKWQGDLALDAGDIITCTDKKGVVRKLPILSQKLTYTGGFTAEIAAKGESKNKNSFSSNGSMGNKVERVVTELALVNKAFIDYAHINDADIRNLKVETAKIQAAEIEIADINNLLAGNISADNIQAGFITAESGLIANGAISDAMIQDLGVSKIKAGNISTNKFVVASDSGNLKIQDNTLKVWDTTGKERVSLGLNGNDYNLLVRGADGNTVLFGTDGVTNKGITEGAVDDSKIATNANINAGKIEKESLVSQINGANTSLKASKVKLDTENQTLDLAFTGLKSTVTDTEKKVTSQGTVIGTIQGHINSKIWQQDITTAVDNIQVGGRNLVENTQYKDPIELWGSGTTKTINSNALTISNTLGVNYGYVTKRNLELEQGKTYTLSFDLQADGTTDTLDYSFIMSNLQGNTILTSISLIKDSSWHRYSIQITPTKNYTDAAILVGFRKTSGIAATFSVKNLKLELGNKATDWTLAPEDTDAQITTISNKYSSIDQTVEGITTDVKNLKTTTSNLGEAVSDQGTKVEQLSKSITQKVWSTDIDKSISNINIGGRNLLIDRTITKGYYIDNNGGLIANNNSITSDFIAVGYTKPYIITNANDVGNYIKRIAYYDANKIFIRRDLVYAPISTELTNIPSNCKYIRFSTDSYIKDKCKIEIGNKPTDWSPAPEDTDAQIDSIATRMKTAEQKITADAIVSTVRSSSNYKSDLSGKISTTNLSSEIQQRAGDVQVAFNNISSNINNSSGMFTIKNGAMKVLSGSGRTAFKVDTDGYIYNEWGVKSQCPPGQIIPVFGHTLADGNCSTLLRPFGLWHESIDDKYQMRIGSKNMIQFVNLADEWQDIGCRWAYVNQIRTSSLDGGAAVMRGNAIDSLEASSTRLWLNYYSGKSVCVGDGTRGGYGSLSCQDFNAYGSKNAVIKTKDYGDLAINAYETAEYYFGDIGSGKLINGECVIWIDDIFGETINTNIVYHVFLSKYGEGDIWVAERHRDYFVVKGITDIEFAWELKAKRTGYENNRLIDIKKDEILEESPRCKLELDKESPDNYYYVEGELNTINNFNIENILLGDDLNE